MLCTYSNPGPPISETSELWGLASSDTAPKAQVPDEIVPLMCALIPRDLARAFEVPGHSHDVSELVTSQAAVAPHGVSETCTDQKAFKDLCAKRSSPDFPAPYERDCSDAQHRVSKQQWACPPSSFDNLHGFRPPKSRHPPNYLQDDQCQPQMLQRVPDITARSPHESKQIPSWFPPEFSAAPADSQFSGMMSQMQHQYLEQHPAQMQGMQTNYAFPHMQGQLVPYNGTDPMDYQTGGTPAYSEMPQHGKMHHHHHYHHHHGPISTYGTEATEEDEEQQLMSDTCAVKRSRLVWTPALHKRFEEAVTKLGIDKAVPKTIMQEMKIEGLTRENVASHLQKWRHLKKKVSSSDDKDYTVVTSCSQGTNQTSRDT